MMPSLPPGVYEHVLTRALDEALAQLGEGGSERRVQELDWVDDALARYLSEKLQRTLQTFGPQDQAVQRRADLVAELLDVLARHKGPVELPGDLPLPTREALTWVAPRDGSLARHVPPVRPEHGLVHPSLLFNGQQEVSLLHELEREFASADAVDAIVAFLRFSGFKLLEGAMRRFVERGGVLRLVCSTYTGATEARAVRELVGIGARVRVAYEEDGTRLHAKAWLFRRKSGLSTAYVGSSNLSRSAMTDGSEWNVRVTQAATPALVERFEAAFDQFWEAVVEDFDPDTHGHRLSVSLGGRRADFGDDVPMLRVDAQPKPHQERVLDALTAERRHGHRRNLVVAATGTGKTWVAAFDYRRLRQAGEADTLLFVAHRREILKQTLAVFRTVLQDPGFGELLVDGARPTRGQHVFASIQSLGPALEDLDPERYTMVVVDEFHHAAAKTYTELLGKLRPRFLLGLTATPERADGKDVFHWFDHRIASEIRLWDALDEGLLVPFHYFGVHDPQSAETAFRRGRFVASELENLYTGDDLRGKRIVDAVHRYVSDPQRMRALGFCVGVRHARLMAKVFEDHGLRAMALDGEAPASERDAAVRRLETGQICALFTVDLFNEGVDIPRADTVLFLRPTESAAVFLQQLGRGLRRHPEKGQLVVLDFVGHVHKDYRYEIRYQALVGGTRKQVREQVERDFPRLPPGCAIRLEEQARDVVLGGIRDAIGGEWKRLVEDLRAAGDVPMKAFLDQAGLEPEEVYRAGRGWTALRRMAGFERSEPRADEAQVQRRLGRLLHVDDDDRLEKWRRWLSSGLPPFESLDAPERALAWMLAASVGDRRRPVEDFQAELDAFFATPLRRELVELLEVLTDRVRHVTTPLHGQRPLHLHGTYTRPEVVAGFGVTAQGRLRESREGPMWVEGARTDVFFVTLDKSDDQFKPSIRYADVPLAPRLFQWESQNNTHEGTDVGRRYVDHERLGSRVMLMVRERRLGDAGETLPFTCLGYARYLRHEGGRPMRILWELDAPMPAALLTKGRVIGAA